MDEATAEDEDEESNSNDVSEASSAPQTIIMNQTRTIDERMFWSAQAESRCVSSDGIAIQQPGRVISFLAEDESFVKANSESLTDQLIGLDADTQSLMGPENHNNSRHSEQTRDKEPGQSSLARLDGILSGVMAEEKDLEPIDHSHLTRFGKTSGDYLLDLGRTSSAEGLASFQRMRPMAFVVEDSRKIGKID